MPTPVLSSTPPDLHHQVLHAERRAARQWLGGLVLFVAGAVCLMQGSTDWGAGVLITTTVLNAFWLGQWMVARRIRLQTRPSPLPSAPPLQAPSGGVSETPPIRSFSSIEEARHMGWGFSGVSALFENAPIPRYANWGNARYEYAGLAPASVLPGSHECRFGGVVYRLSGSVEQKSTGAPATSAS